MKHTSGPDGDGPTRGEQQAAGAVLGCGLIVIGAMVITFALDIRQQFLNPPAPEKPKIPRVADGPPVPPKNVVEVGPMPREAPERLTKEKIRELLEEAGIDVEAILARVRATKDGPPRAQVVVSSTSAAAFSAVQGTKMEVGPMPQTHKRHFRIQVGVDKTGQPTYDVEFDGTWSESTTVGNNFVWGPIQGDHISCSAGENPTCDRMVRQKRIFEPSETTTHEKDIPMDRKEQDAVMKAVRAGLTAYKADADRAKAIDQLKKNAPIQGDPDGKFK